MAEIILRYNGKEEKYKSSYKKIIEIKRLLKKRDKKTNDLSSLVRKAAGSLKTKKSWKELEEEIYEDFPR